MNVKKAIQQKMRRGNSWGDGKQHLEELFKITFFDRFVEKRLGWKWFGTAARPTIFLNG